jgi:hypothetical protein
VYEREGTDFAEKTYLLVRAKVRTIGLCYFCPDHKDCSGEVHIVFGARGQERNGTSIGKTGNRLVINPMPLL